MGGFSKLITDLIQTAKQITETLQATIILERCTGDEKMDEKMMGTRQYADPDEYKVLLTKKTRFVGIDGGVSGVQIISVTFLDPVNITPQDKITLPDGTQPQIVSIEGFADPNGLYYAPRVIF